MIAWIPDLKPFLSLMMLLCCAEAHGGINGPPITDNNYNLDVRQGPIIGSARQVAMGGAYIGVAEGVTALNSNPAGVAFRLERSTEKFDWDWTVGLNNLKSNDFDNNGVSPPDYKTHQIQTLGLMGQYGPWGIGVLNNSEILSLEGLNSDDEYVLSVTSLALGRQFLDRELTVGAGIRATMTKLRNQPFDATLGKISGTGWDVGALWNPERGPYRFGAVYSSSISSNQSLTNTGGTPVTVNGLIVPQQVILPATLGLGMSYGVESAPFWEDHKWLVASDLLFTAASDNAVGVESVLAQKMQPVGTHNTTSLRLGSELETMPGRLRLRLGSYYEPSNYEGVPGRTHLTGGFEARMFHTSFLGEYDWSLTYTVDSARDYLNMFVALGFWYY